MNDFAAIDFETANHQPTSVCSIGIVIVRNGIVTDKFYSLIHPVPNYYNLINTQIHGITEADTCDAPFFPEVWSLIEPLLHGLTLVAHNSPFDERCLKASFEYYDMPYPGYKFLCTCRASRRMFGRSLPNHQLHTVASHCGYNLKDHHHALADAEACAHIALNIL